jgi:hypothetical protein
LIRHSEGGFIVNVHQSNLVHKVHLWDEFERNGAPIGIIIGLYCVLFLNNQHVALWNAVLSWLVRFATLPYARTGWIAELIRGAKIRVTVLRITNV